MQTGNGLRIGAALIVAVVAMGTRVLPAQEPYPPVPANGPVASQPSPGGGYPAGGLSRPVTPSQPVSPVRPDGFPGGSAASETARWDASAPAAPGTAARPYGPIFRGSPPTGGRVVPANYSGRSAPSATMAPPAPAVLCEGAQILGRVGDDVILTSDVLLGVDDMMARAKGRIPPEKLGEQRAVLVQEITAAIREFNEHFREPDPVKAMSPSRRTLLHQLVRQQIDVKLIYQDFRKTVPKEALPSFEESIARHFDEVQLKVLMKREKVVARADLENALRAKGSSLDREKRIFKEQVVAQQWVQQQLKTDDPITHEEMIAWYRAHIKDFERPAKAQWEELTVSFRRYPTREEAYSATAAMGNQVLAGASFADVAKAGSDGPTARQGGLRDWIQKGSLSSEAMDAAIFSLPVGQMSPILESDSGFHIVRVVQRQERSTTSFLDAQKDVKDSIQKERFEKRYKEFTEKLHSKYPVWTVFDNAVQQPKNADEDDRYR